MQTPWIESVTLPKEDATLKRAIRIEPVPVGPIETESLDLAVELLQSALKVPYRASDQHVRVIRQIFGPILAHARMHYGSHEQFVRGSSGQVSMQPDPRITVLTGQPGVGKSALLLAIARLMQGGTAVEASKRLPPFPLKPIVHLPIRSNISKAELYSLIAHELGLEHEYEARSEGDLKHLLLRMYQRGCCGVHTDELQFVSRSTAANSNVSALITRLADLGRPLTLTMNYSLVHKLKKRPPEERVRVLSSPIIMLPDHGDDPDYIAYLDDLKGVMDGRLEIDPQKDSPEIVALTGGLKRPLIRLLSFAYKVARQESRRQSSRVTVYMDHLRKAYSSLEYEEDRKLIEQCHRALLGLGNVSNEYLCPFELPVEQERQLQDRADQLREWQLARSELAAALGKSPVRVRPPASDLPASLSGIEVPSSVGHVPPPKAKSRRTPPPRTASDLLSGLSKLVPR